MNALSVKPPSQAYYTHADFFFRSKKRKKKKENPHTHAHTQK